MIEYFMLRHYLNLATLFMACMLCTRPAWATTTSGATMRNVVMDGVVTLGATPGANGSDWETDEEFQGFTGAVNWYVTWDDSNLYLGRIGGNNAEGSVIYLRADYPGATLSPQGFDYDQLAPDVTPMGGVNFAVYLKDSYHEFRTYSSGWSGAVTTLSPLFSTQSTGAHMEVVIPWTAITAGNGRPTNVRLVLYQVVPAGIACPQEFVYGESPWGTGNPGDGPSLGVNDGVPVSLRQPGGCDVGDSTAWRWWGCYPVIGGVGSNGWAALAPNAGPDDSICQTATAYFLQGNTPPGQATGTWSVVGQPPGSPPVTFTAPSNPNTFAQNLTGFGAYTFVWDINYGGCPSLPDTVVVTRVPNSNAAGTMQDTTLGCNGDTVLLRGNDPGNGFGLWTTSLPGITIVSPSDSVTLAHSLAPGANVFTYTISNGVCPATTDQVIVFVPIDVTAHAGSDQTLCFASLTTMTANDPITIQSTATGLWSQLSGPNAAIFSNIALFSSNVSALVPGTYTFAWTVSNHDCPVATDTLLLVNYDRPLADAGGDQVYCLGAPVTLNGNDITSLGSAAAASWSQLAGPSQALIANPAGPLTTVANLVGGNYTFSWRVTNGNCPADSDNVHVQVLQVQDQGATSVVHPDSGHSNGMILVAQPIGGISPYVYSLDGLNFDSNAHFGNLAAGTYTVHLMDAYGCGDTFSITLVALPPSDTIPGLDTIRIPSGFSPNGDGTNDTWEIPGIDAFPHAQIEVFNAWGGLVFRSVGAYQPWNGQRNGQDLPTANYYYIVDLKAAGQAAYKGSLTILR